MPTILFKQYQYELPLHYNDAKTVSAIKKEFTIPGNEERSSVFYTKSSPGIDLIAWNYNTDRDIDVEIKNEIPLFSLHYFVQSEKLLFLPVQESRITLQRGRDQQALTLFLSLPWLISNFYGEKQKALSEVFSKASRPVSFTIAGAEVNKCAVILNAVFNDNWNYILLNAGLMNMLEHFGALMLAWDHRFTEVSSGSSVLNKVETLLVEALHDQMPALAFLAKEVMMSESTLKRKFKARHKMSINEYYLSRKMELAALLLRTTHRSVSRIAYEIGYENVSPFIRMHVPPFL